MHLSTISAVVIAFATILGLSGCGEPTESNPSNEQAAPDDHGDHVHGDQADVNMEMITTNLAKLSPEDAASAKLQGVCPMSGDMLGAMGTPIKLDLNGQSVWICCEDCREEVMNNPDEYLAKLKKE